MARFRKDASDNDGSAERSSVLLQQEAPPISAATPNPNPPAPSFPGDKSYTLEPAAAPSRVMGMGSSAEIETAPRVTAALNGISTLVFPDRFPLKSPERVVVATFLFVTSNCRFIVLC